MGILSTTLRFKAVGRAIIDAQTFIFELKNTQAKGEGKDALLLQET